STLARFAYPDYNEDHPFTKNEMADKLAEVLSDTRNNGRKVAVNGCNQYAWAGADMVYKMDTKGILTPLADGFNGPCGVCWSNGSLYVADTGNHRICVIENGLIRVFAGSREGFRDGTAEESCFQNPQGVTVGEDGNVYVADTGNSAIRVIKDGEVKTLLNCTDDSTWPVAPVSLAPYKGGLVVVDDFAGVVFTMPYVKK
ncbi:MAG: SMP-30/gluconolactonase/LRE family protein, partial [Lachnospiraceae bacterium]|nr:SMP-30/gluconolactonase/LRE family protein [Lachnospiraceae bacterium]